MKYCTTYHCAERSTEEFAKTKYRLEVCVHVVSLARCGEFKFVVVCFRRFYNIVVWEGG